MCSTQCEAPVIPGRSFLEPTRYHTQTLAVGLVASGARRTRSPFPKVSDRTFGRRTPDLRIERAPALFAYNAPPGGVFVREGHLQLRHNR